jgi:hypothetical protein
MCETQRLFGLALLSPALCCSLLLCIAHSRLALSLSPSFTAITLSLTLHYYCCLTLLNATLHCCSRLVLFTPTLHCLCLPWVAATSCCSECVAVARLGLLLLVVAHLGVVVALLFIQVLISPSFMLLLTLTLH